MKRTIKIASDIIISNMKELSEFMNKKTHQEELLKALECGDLFEFINGWKRSDLISILEKDINPEEKLNKLAQILVKDDFIYIENTSFKDGFKILKEGDKFLEEICRGGRLELLQGNYILDNEIIELGNSVEIKGIGRGRTNIILKRENVVFKGNSQVVIKIKNLTVKSIVNESLLEVNGLQAEFDDINLYGVSVNVNNASRLNIKNSLFENIDVAIRQCDERSLVLQMNNKFEKVNKQIESCFKVENMKGFKELKDSLINDFNAVRDLISEFHDVSNKQINIDNQRQSLERALNQLTTGVLKVMVIGEFSTGKSTFLNALIGEKILPSSVKPTTAAINIIKYSDKKQVIVYFNNGNKKEIDISELPEYTTSLSKNADKLAKSIKNVEIYYPLEYCKNGVEIIDTPGLNSSNEYHQSLTLSYFPEGNVGIFLLNPKQPLTASERSMLNIIKKYLHKVKFVVNQIDLLDEDELEESLKYIKDELYKELKTNVNIDLYPISSKLALKGELEKSGMNRFKKDFEMFLLSDEKTNLLITRPVIIVFDILRTIKENTEFFLNSLTLNESIYDEKIKYLNEKIVETKKGVQEVVEFIENQSEEAISLSSKYAHDIFETKVLEIEQKILNWGDIKTLKDDLNKIIKESMEEAFYNYKKVLNEMLKRKFSEIDNKVKESLDKISKLGFSSNNYENINIQEIEYSFEGLSFLEVLLSGGIAIIVAKISAVILGPVGWILAGIGALIYNVVRSESIKADKLKQIADKVVHALQDHISESIENVNIEIKNTFVQYRDGYIRRVNDEVESMQKMIEQTKIIRTEEEHKINEKLRKCKDLLIKVTKLENRIASKSQRFLNASISGVGQEIN